MVNSDQGETKESRYKTGIDGLDLLLHRGFVLPSSGDGLVLLIKGKPGTGKSTLALKIAKNVAEGIDNERAEDKRKGKKNWMYFSCEQKKVDILVKSKKFGFEIEDDNICDDSFYSREIDPSESIHSFSRTTLMWAMNIMYKYFIDAGQDDLDKGEDNNSNQGEDNNSNQSGDNLLDRINQSDLNKVAQDDLRKDLVVIDGLNLMGTEERASINMDSLISTLRKYSLFSIIVYEPLEGESSQIDSMVDMIFQLKGEEFDGPPVYYLNKINISKSRFQRCVLGWHQYKIKEKKGLIVFPSIHHYIHKANFFTQETTDASSSWLDYSKETAKDHQYDQQMNSDSIIAKLLKNCLYKGSSTVLLGPRKTCKTLLSIDFLKDGSRKGEKGLLISIIDNRETIINNAVFCTRESYKKQQECENGKNDGCSNNFLFHFRPGCITSNEFFNNLHYQVCQHNPKRVVFWDLPQIDFNYPLISNDTMFFPAMIDYLKNSNMGKDGSILEKKRDIASVVIGSFHCKLAKSAFTIADNVILLLRESELGINSYKDKNKEEDSIYAYVDRIEGRPGVHYLLRIPFKSTSEEQKCQLFDKPETIYSNTIVKRFQVIIEKIEKYS